MIIKKAGCVLINLETKKIGLIYRKKLNDYSFPKGHLEKNEDLISCALRETEEETGRKCHIISNEFYIIKYNNFEGEINSYMYLAIDDGKTDKYIKDEDKEILAWTNYSDIPSRLTYENLIDFWDEIKEKVYEVLYRTK